MSVVAQQPSLIHQPYSDTDLFHPPAHRSNQTELPRPIEFPVGPSHLQFPPFQHRHSSPMSLMTQSFSALGPPPDPTTLQPNIISITPPPAPKPSVAPLPPVTPDSTVLPPTPDPSPSSSKIHYAPIMVALAPPAEDIPAISGLQVEEVRVSPRWDDDPKLEGIPRRSPVVSVEDLLEDIKHSEQLGETPAGRARSHSLGQPTVGFNPVPKPINPPESKTNVMGPPSQRIKRSQTAVVLPKSIRMQESKSADSRIRVRPNPSISVRRSVHSHHPTSPSPGLQRTHTTEIPTPPRSGPLPASAPVLPPPDLGGPDGLEAKVVLLGSQGVGKTSLILRYTTRKFTPTVSTIGSSFHTRKLMQHGTQIRLQIWDTAGQERFRSMAPMYYRGSHVCILVYDISDRQSFEDVYSWLEELGRTVSKETLIFVVGMKTDLEPKRMISLGEARETIRRWLKPVSTNPLPQIQSPPSRGLFRRDTNLSRAESSMSSPAPTRSHSHSALTSLVNADPLPARIPALRIELPSPIPSSETPTPATAPSSAKPSKPSNRRHKPSISVSRPSVKITSPVSPTQVTFPDLQSPSKATYATYSELARAALTPVNRHSSRFSFSGLLGFSSTQISEATTSLARLAEEHPPTRRPSPDPNSTSNPLSSSSASISGQTYQPFRVPTTPPRIRTESSPLLGTKKTDVRRKSEDWSTGRPWRAGQGPPSEEVLGEFGEAVRKRASGEMLSPPSGSSYVHGRRPRGGSVGTDSRLNRDGTPRSSVSDDEPQWGTLVEHIYLGECSALTGDGVEALFKTISALLVDKKDTIERERTLRHKNSIMLKAPEDESSGVQTNRTCCV
ncbi:hypothetical protein M231_08019 [Tremella mesenterica]|uniref:Rab family, other n=2 Tax=Tremella mesenterica TaxID=5217 RepID=A0A4Q1BF70_TREME|nr:hypothetical protein M231_08019 [Tremella mesenterica]